MKNVITNTSFDLSNNLQYIETVAKIKKDIVEYIKNYQDDEFKELLSFKKYYDNENEKNVFKVIYKDKYNCCFSITISNGNIYSDFDNLWEHYFDFENYFDIKLSNLPWESNF